MAMNSSLSGSEYRLFPTWVSLRNLGYSFLVDFHVSDPNAVPRIGSRQVGTFEKLRGTVVTVHSDKVIMFICPNLQEKEGVIEAFSRFSVHHETRFLH